jgi:hypothetical protein
MALGIATTTACPGGDTSSDFEGTWTYNSGSSLTVTCPTGTGSDTADITGNEEFRPGTDTDFVVISSAGCNIKFNASGTHADAIPGQSCSSVSGGVTTTMTFNNASYVMDVKSMTLSFSAAGTVKLMGPGGEATCTVSASATLHKVSN